MRIVKKDDITEPFVAPLGEKIYEMIGRPTEIGGTTNHSFVHVVIPPGKSSPKHYHKVSEETYYVLAGRGRIIIDGKEKIISPGDACLIMPGEIHQIFVESDENLEFLTVSAPAWVPTDTYIPED
ncbi:cupin domain-containing protein [uncultured Roseibium sp.]|uniref:cupin domain-containing protein n=1 Tax=uncultured Roseibium sp. TaxID=1936171 RepID=UPI00321657AE